MRPREIFAVAAPGLEALALRELQGLPFGNFARAEALAGGVSMMGHDQAVYRANMWLRTSSRVLVRVGRGKAMHKKELVQKLRRMDWAPYLQPRNTKLNVRATSRKSKLINTALIEEATRTALNNYTHDGSRNEQEIIISFERDAFTVSINSSGDNLHKRWYRQQVATPMPLRETVAAGMHLGSWGRVPEGEDAAARPVPSVIVDPFCGSGTLSIEAALILASCAPGLVRMEHHPARAFPFVDWPMFEPARFQQVAEEALSVRKERPPHDEPVSLGFDREKAAVEIATACAARAGMDRWCAFAQRDVTTDGLPSVQARGPGLGALVTNPPYGPRFQGPIRRIFNAFGTQLDERYKGWQLALLAPADFRGVTALRQPGMASSKDPAHRFDVRNGGRRMRVFMTPNIV